MGPLSRGLLARFFNIPFVRRQFHYLLSDKDRLAWLNRRIQFGQIFQHDPDASLYPALTRDRAFIFVSRFSYPKHNIWPRVGEEVLRIEQERTDIARGREPKEYSYRAKFTPGLKGYQGYRFIEPLSCSQSRLFWRFGPMPLTFALGKVIWQLERDMFSLDCPEPRLPPQSTITTTGLTVRLKAAPQSPGAPANTGPKARLRYSASSPEREESIGRNSSKKT